VKQERWAGLQRLHRLPQSKSSMNAVFDGSQSSMIAGFDDRAKADRDLHKNERNLQNSLKNQLTRQWRSLGVGEANALTCSFDRLAVSLFQLLFEQLERAIEIQIVSLAVVASDVVDFVFPVVELHLAAGTSLRRDRRYQFCPFVVGDRTPGQGRSTAKDKQGSERQHWMDSHSVPPCSFAISWFANTNTCTNVPGADRDKVATLSCRLGKMICCSARLGLRGADVLATPG
jgi:hypothetical protein